METTKKWQKTCQTIDQLHEEMDALRENDIEDEVNIILSKGTFFIENNPPAFLRVGEKIIWSGAPQNYSPEKLKLR